MSPTSEVCPPGGFIRWETLSKGLDSLPPNSKSTNIYIYICIYIYIKTKLLITVWFYQKMCHEFFLFELGFPPCKTEQPLQGMELQEKEAYKY